MNDKIEIFIKRLKRIGIDVKLASNYPWIYLDRINGRRVTETFHAEHGFTIAFYPIRKNQELHFTDISEIFKLIRQYITERGVVNVDVMERGLFMIDEDPKECDFCDVEKKCASINTINLDVICVCKDCLEKFVKAFDE